MDERLKHITKVTKARSAGGFRRRLARPGECGQAMVEMAFVLPIFLVFVFAIMEMGRAWGAKQSLTNAAREGARILALPYGAGLPYASEDEVKDAARNAVKALMNSSGTPVAATTQIMLVRITPGPNGIYDHTLPNDDVIEQNYTGGKRGERVGVRITYLFETPAPILLGMFDSGAGSSAEINMGVSCYMEHE